jgi:hypothetical protein
MAMEGADPAFRALLAESRAQLDEASRLVKAAEVCAASDAADFSVDLFAEINRNVDQARKVLDAAGIVYRLTSA